jgi:hypothetical protein
MRLGLTRFATIMGQPEGNGTCGPNAVLVQVIALKRIFTSSLAVSVLFLTGISTAFAAGNGSVGNIPDDESKDPSSVEIINRYLQAHGSEQSLRGASMQVEINANVPKLKENGKLSALRRISKMGQVTYRVIAFQGQSFVKKEVIARYLQAEQQTKVDGNVDVIPENYKFRYKGQRQTDSGTTAYVFQLQPRKKRVGLFKGEMWLDSSMYLPVFEKGRLVKNPSIFFKKVDFERGFSIQDGHAIPSYITSTIDTRLVGRVELNISYSKFAPETTGESGAGAGEVSMLTPQF